MVTGDFDNDGKLDYVASAPYKRINNKAAAGAVFPARGRSAGATPFTFTKQTMHAQGY